MSALVYEAITSVTAELADAGIAKARRNEESGYSYRGIEDVLNALSPLLAKHKLCVLPRVLERSASPQSSRVAGQLVVLRVAFDLVSAIDASRHGVESFGEAWDESDKGTAKAMSAAYKAAMLQVFCIPVPQEDSDAFNHPATRNSSHNAAEPPDGWESWSSEVIDVARSCESTEAIDRLLGRRRIQLAALQRSRPELYAKTGEAIAAKLSELQRPGKAAVSTAAAPRKPKKRERAHAHSATAEAA